MRKTGSKTMASFLALVMALTIAISANSSSETEGALLPYSISKTTRPDFFYASQEEILEEYARCVGINAVNGGEYGGVFIDDCGNAVVNVKGNSGNVEMASNGGSVNLTTSDGARTIVVRNVKYSMAELKSAESKILELVPFIDGYVVREMGIDEEQNNIEVLIEQHEDVDKFLSILLEKSGLPETCSDMFKVEVFEDNDELEYMSSTVGGTSKLSFTDSNNTTHNFSAAIKSISSTYGAGFITTGHVGLQVGDYVKCGSDTIGQVEEVHHDGTDDTAFVSFYNQSNWDVTVTYQDEYFVRNVTPAQGSYVKLRGYQSDPYVRGTVDHTSRYYYDTKDNIGWTDMLEVGCAVEHGDSGGACFGVAIEGGRTGQVVGVISQGNSVRTLVIKSSNVANY